MDTRTSSNILNKTRKLPFNDSFVVNALGQCSGMVLLWNTRSINLEIIQPHDRFIHCRLTDLTLQHTSFITFVYAYPKKEKQLELWNTLATLQPPYNDCWALIGDFNSILDLEEKLGGNQVVTRYMLKFSSFLNDLRLLSLRASGLPFTWTNKHEDDTLMFERLDRAYVNSNFLNDYPNLKLENLPIIGLDHGPICLTSILSSGTKVEQLFYGNIFKRMENLNSRSYDIQQQLMIFPTSQTLKERDMAIREELMQLYKDEETYRHKKQKQTGFL
ncbi:uncharacterized protein LOC133728453 [Rosa rugosa]|uniref:uncharacterized protein LOC133728453 n=1 Tax=Rosa rugosa TaxID=74645 RepID=UPI002B411BC1|nr:uncharacterized protein LOC133728453 [Rosa rugosa]